MNLEKLLSNYLKNQELNEEDWLFSIMYGQILKKNKLFIKS